jgi:galactose mutarotase-like enzyme
MARFIEIRDGGLCAKVAPDNGGMVAQVSVDGADTLMLNEAVLETTPMSAGGAPVLFPFPSRTRDDAYRLDGQVFAMPMHGLVKNAAFAVKRAAEKSVTLWIDGSASQKQANYPFDYTLEITYEVRGASDRKSVV